MRYVSFTMAVIFVAFAALQYNDPDPYVWMPVYGWMAFLSLRRAFAATSTTTIMRYLPHVTSAVFIVWTIYTYTQTTGQWWGGEVERETGGLAICAVWAIVLMIVTSDE